jgi:DNA-binding XRE family transcriptional regulator
MTGYCQVCWSEVPIVGGHTDMECFEALKKRCRDLEGHLSTVPWPLAVERRLRDLETAVGRITLGVAAEAGTEAGQHGEEKGLLLGRRLKAAAEASQKTSAELAKDLGVCSSTVRAWWSGRNDPGASDLFDYARATGLPLTYFMGGEPTIAAALAARQEAQP